MAHASRLDLGPLERAIQRLDEGWIRYQQDISDTQIRDGLIQRFEFTYELAWKSMFLWMKDEGEKVREMVRPVIQAAFRCELIDDPDTWEEIKDYRDETSHTYNESKAIEVAGFVRHQAVALFDRLRDELRDL